MTTILPTERSSWDVIGKQIGANLNQHLPGAVQQGYQRQMGMNALDQAEKEIQSANGDPYKIALAMARAGAQNPNLERALGPLMQTAMSQAKVNRAFPQQPGQQQSQQLPGFMQQPGQPQSQMQNGMQPNQQAMKFEQGAVPQAQPSNFATPGPFNVMTADEIDAEAQRYANAVQDPNAYSTRQAQLNNQNEIANSQRSALEDMALKSHIRPDELPRFMNVGSKNNTKNPTEWMQNTLRDYNEVKSNDTKLQKAFIPGLGNALLGANRDESLKRLGPTVRDQVRLGQEQETRNFLADNYVTPTETAELIHPLTPQKEKALKSLPKGIFPAEKGEGLDIFNNPDKSFISYEEAREKAPKELQAMQNRLSDFFLKNVDDDTSLLVLRDKLWEDKDYDWRQIGPAIREAEQKGLKLNKAQSTEMADIETQPPYQSLPDIFQSMDRVVKFFRGNK